MRAREFGFLSRAAAEAAAWSGTPALRACAGRWAACWRRCWRAAARPTRCSTSWRCCRWGRAGRGGRGPGVGGRERGLGGRAGRRLGWAGPKWGPPATGLSLQSEDHEETQEAVRACSRLFGALLERGELFVGPLPSEDSVMAGERPRVPGWLRAPGWGPAAGPRSGRAGGDLSPSCAAGPGWEEDGAGGRGGDSPAAG